MGHSGDSIDPVTLQVLWNKFRGITQEVGEQLARTGYSTNVKYRDDFSTGLFTSHGRLISQGVYTPGHLGSLPPAMNTILDKYFPRDSWNPGDVVLTNDPYICAGHLPDFFLFEPIFLDSELIGFFTTTCHMQDVGGAVAESMATHADELYQEGLQIPPIKLYDEGDRNRSVVQIIDQNSRAPATILGDLRAQRNATGIGRDQFRDVCEEYGVETVRRYVDEILDRSEQQMRDSIREIANGSYSSTDFVDGFEEKIPLEVTVTVDDDTIHVDWDGTADQVEYAINSTRNYTYAYTLLAVRSVVESETPQTHGTLSPISMEAPKGSVLNPERPAAVGSRHLIASVITNPITTALHEAAPEKVAASGGAPVRLAIQFSSKEDGDSILSDGIWGASGARPDRDGNPAISLPQNVSNTPIEVVETRHPVRINEYKIETDTAGAGTFRGGNGTVREYEFFDSGKVQFLAERFERGPRGLAGGGNGAKASAVLVTGEGESQELRSKTTFDIAAHDRLLVTTVGGGGFGDPEERASEAVVEDLENELISEDVASEVYDLD
jgi:N-methylhydantoinase B